MSELRDVIATAMRHAEGVLVELQAENARLREALITIRDKREACTRAVDCQFVAREALNATGPVVLATPDVVKTMVKEARERALEDAARQFTKDETYTGCVVLHRLEKLRGKSDG